LFNKQTYLERYKLPTAMTEVHYKGPYALFQTISNHFIYEYTDIGNVSSSIYVYVYLRKSPLTL